MTSHHIPDTPGGPRRRAARRAGGRFVAPRFDVVAGGAGLEGAVSYACALTTAADAAPDRAGTWLHACRVDETAPGRCHWRTTTSTGPGASASVEGDAPSVADAIADAVRAIRHPAEAGLPAIMPAFVETRAEPGLPRIRVCSFLLAADPEDADWTHLQRCTIREFPGRPRPFRCQVEGVPRAMLLAGLRAGLDDLGIVERAGLGHRSWDCVTLAEAEATCLRAALDGTVMERRRPRPIGRRTA